MSVKLLNKMASNKVTKQISVSIKNEEFNYLV